MKLKHLSLKVHAIVVYGKIEIREKVITGSVVKELVVTGTIRVDYIIYVIIYCLTSN
jgi:hypothetical protein